MDDDFEGDDDLEWVHGDLWYIDARTEDNKGKAVQKLAQRGWTLC